LHKIEEGHVGIYYNAGILSKELADPGFHFLIPYYTEYESI